MRSIRGGLALILAVAGLAGRAGADVLDPTKFPDLGALTSGAVINTGDGTSTPTIQIGGGGPTLDGTIFHQPGGIAVAVFSFDSIDAAGIGVTGSLPVALLSRGDATIGGTIILIGGNSGGPFAGTGGPGGGAGGGPGPDGGGVGPGGGGVGGDTFPDSNGGGGGGFGGPGGSGGVAPHVGAGGPAYGNLLTALQGGSGGGGGGVDSSGGAGGGGGGAIEIVALGTLTVSGTILADGGDNLRGVNNGGGGGSGGGIILAGDSVILSGSLSARGGNGGFGSLGGGGGGGGGRILIETGPGGLTGTPLDSWVSGGAGGRTQFGPPSFDGSDGVLTILTVPEPSSFALLGLGAASGLALLARRRRPVPAREAV